LQHTCEIAHKCERKPNIALFETNESINYSLPIFSQLSDIFASQPFLLTIFRKIVFSIRGIKIAAKNLPTQKQKQKKYFLYKHSPRKIILKEQNSIAVLNTSIFVKFKNSCH
jgi:hypothetical protein